MHECIQHGVSAWYERGCYTCLKVRGLAGGSLTRAEADFAGLYEPQRPSGGWHSPDLPAFEPDEPSTETTEFLHALMTIGQDQLEVPRLIRVTLGFQTFRHASASGHLGVTLLRYNSLR